MSAPTQPRVRLSLETTRDFKDQVRTLSVNLDTPSIIGTLRTAVRWSLAISKAIRAGGTILVRRKNGTVVDLKL
jgi:hypothetical protein